MKSSFYHLAKLSALLVCSLALTLIFSAFIFVHMVFGQFSKQDTSAIFKRNKHAFQDMANKIETRSIKSGYDRHSYIPTKSLSDIGIIGVIDDTDGVIEFSFGLEIFDGPTRIIIYDSKGMLKGDFSKYITGNRPPLIFERMGEWTYIKNDD
jgi:hypothetical protein